SSPPAAKRIPSPGPRFQGTAPQGGGNPALRPASRRPPAQRALPVQARLRQLPHGVFAQAEDESAPVSVRRVPRAAEAGAAGDTGAAGLAGPVHRAALNRAKAIRPQPKLGAAGRIV